MEADTITSGFQLSENMHGLRYMKLIGDGDSSVLYTIHTTVRPYGREVEKIECANHAVKCYWTRLEQLAKDFPSFRGRGGLTKSVIMKITHGAYCAICQHSASNDIDKLRKDLRAGPNTTWAYMIPAIHHGALKLETISHKVLIFMTCHQI